MKKGIVRTIEATLAGLAVFILLILYLRFKAISSIETDIDIGTFLQDDEFRNYALARNETKCTEICNDVLSPLGYNCTVVLSDTFNEISGGFLFNLFLYGNETYHRETVVRFIIKPK